MCNKPKALIAMSGGVDSSVSAYLMKQQHYDCIGVTMHLFSNQEAGLSKEKSCCSLSDVEDAKSIAVSLGIPYYVFNFTDEFKEKVIHPFVSQYESGGTPNPCIDCNRYLKFDKLYQRGMALGFNYVVTGHYARIEEKNGRYLLKKAIDPRKDQSYVLYAMTQDQLAHTIFPLGSMDKITVRKIAEEQGFINADKKDSQDICFVPDGNYSDVIEKHTGKTYKQGNFIDKNGKILGKHKGIIRYTIGQRKGLGIAADHPLYVCGKNVETNEIILGSNEDLLKKELNANDFNWIVYKVPPDRFRAKAKIRYNQEEQWATVSATASDSVHIVFDEPQRAIAKGQAVVLYDGDIVVGGGTIA